MRQPASPARATRAAQAVVGPALFAYGAIRLVARAHGAYGPGAAWTVGHAALLVGQAGVLVVLLAEVMQPRPAGRPSRRRLVLLLLLAGAAGQLLALVQCGLDLYAGAVSSTPDELAATFARLHALSWTTAVYSPVSLLGMLATTVLVARSGARPAALRVGRTAGAVTALLCVLRLDLLPVAGVLYTVLLPTRDRPGAGAAPERVRAPAR